MKLVNHILCDCGNRAVKKKHGEFICARCDRIENELGQYHEPINKMNHINTIVIRAIVYIEKEFVVNVDRVQGDPKKFVSEQLPQSLINNGWEVTDVLAFEEPYTNE